MVNAGYYSYNSVNGFQINKLSRGLIYSALINLAFELVVDVTCWWRESKEIDLVQCWKSISDGKRLNYRLLPFLLLSISGSTLVLYFCMLKERDNDSCDFIRECLPYPCSCFNTTSLSSIESNNRNMTMRPFFLYACDLISKNQTDILMKGAGAFFNKEFFHFP